MDNRKQMRIKHLSFIALRTIEECTVYRFNFINARSFEHNDGSILRTCRNYTLDHNPDSSATPAERICPTCSAKWSQIPASSASQLHYGGRKKTVSNSSSFPAFHFHRLQARNSSGSEFVYVFVRKYTKYSCLHGIFPAICINRWRFGGTMEGTCACVIYA